MLYSAEIISKQILVDRLFNEYCMPDKFLPLCKQCPDYGRVWSCPPDITNAITFKRYKNAIILGIKVIYSDDAITIAFNSAEDANEIRMNSYEKVKKEVLKTLVEIEKLSPPSYTIAAGSCKICKRCARMDGLLCRNPLSLRYSFSGLGFDIGRISSELLNTQLLWAENGLPKYDMAIFAFLTN